MRKLLLVLSVSLIGSTTLADDDYIDLVKQGNLAYQGRDYKSAMEKYTSAITELPESPEISFNQAGAAFMLEDYEQAAQLYARALNTTNVELEAQTHYNLGNTYYRQQDYENAIKSYENSLTLNPDDVSAKFNLELARKMIKENTKPQQQNQDQQQQQDEQKQEQDQQEQDQQDGQDQEQQQDSQQSSDEKENQDKEKQQQQQREKEKKISKEEAERVLDALLDDERKQQKKIKRQVIVGSYSGKDW